MCIRIRNSLFSLVALSAVIADPSSGADQPGKPAGQSMSGNTGSMKMHAAMMKGMNDTQMAGDADKDFAQMMIHHHQQAIAMSQTQLEHGKDATLKAQAKKIIDDSQKDIEVLQSASAKLK